MSYRETEHLRVLIANERRAWLALVAPIVVELGHEVIAREIEVAVLLSRVDASVSPVERQTTEMDEREQHGEHVGARPLTSALQ
jgi:hypothetical protein